jgi:osmoprotectant transport system ATP-binding protein
MDEPFSAVDPVVRAGLQAELLRLQGDLHKTVVFVTHDVEEAIKLGDQVTVRRPGGRVAQSGRPERLLAAPADSYVDDFIGFDRGIRRLSFFPASGLDLDTGAVVSERTTVADGLARAKNSGQPWLLVTDTERRPRGWVATAALESLPRERQLGDVPLDGYGHSFTIGSDSLRAALDATVLSDTGRAVGVDADGRVAGVTSYERLRIAIHAAGALADAGQQGSPA